MRIQLIGHARERHWTIKGSAKKELIGSGDIIEYYFIKKGYPIDHIRREEWLDFFKRYFEFKPDIIMTSGPVGFFISFLKKLKVIKVPVVHFWHDNYVETMGEKWGKNFIKFLENFILNNSDSVITHSWYRYELGKKKGVQIYYIPQGVHKKLFQNSKKIKLPGKNRIKLLYSGNVVPSKKVDLFIKNINGKPLDLIIIGKTPEDIKRISSDNIYFLGLLSHKDVPSYLFSADVLVITENNDSSLKFFEYAQTNKPILAIEGRIEELSKKLGIASIFYEYGNILQKSRLAIQNKKLFKKNSKNISDWKDITEEYHKTLEKIYNDYKKNKRA